MNDRRSSIASMDSEEKTAYEVLKRLGVLYWQERERATLELAKDMQALKALFGWPDGWRYVPSERIYISIDYQYVISEFALVEMAYSG